MAAIDTIRYMRAELPGARPSGRQGYVRRLVRMVNSLANRIGRLLDRRRSRLVLLEMTDDQLKDIGISRADAHREGLRPFWD
ncbi:MAG: DUF1127 domain-containing protein [Mesorhizobium sp.]|uniref:DUF1127 domain-containing protein n=1 Tax=Mesorhizobium TaxID=68287 RepID=UPI000FE39728|nr:MULTISPECIES: DUF1127 domain-containing protein [Mesorhizobium]MCF6114015.1 DUF1127 domain-containing protein [Mesorhizobium muleiense]RWC02418.1 MAG: DUF1127 domain-containing protein [Mesorhizobium sp.]RWO07368.1 MAG: DUF1127 domain-containing protein [Mesorhizobium sp.]RWO35966.1 MAG: DUF1127 domain-containing protein [Mesorhizobium sp.]RWP06848.1 MAG: DUF1127 domain-containing protein [Mesorhizobium sp.]